MTIQRSIAKWMQDNGFGTFGTNLFIGSVPQNAPSASWWILGGGGASSIKAQTGERVKQYIFSVLYRSHDAQDVDEKLQNLEVFANSKACHELQDYETVEVEATGFQSDNDLDGEDRAVGAVEITATVHQS